MYRDLVKSFKFFNVMSDIAYNNPIYNEKKFKIAIKEHKLNSEDLIDNFIKKVNKESNFNKTIVFIAGKCYPMMARQAAFLRKSGFKTFLISMGNINDNDAELLVDSFDEIIHNCLFFPILGKILKKINPGFYHVQCWMWNYTLGKFVLENKGKSKVISEFYDVTGMYSKRSKLKLAFWNKIVDLDFFCEKFIFENSDGIIHRYKQKIFLEYSKKYNRNKNILEFQQYPVNFNQQVSKSKKRLVYCGNIIGPKDKRHPRKLFPTSGMFDAFKQLISQDYEINVYLPISTVGIDKHNSWLIDLTKKYPKNFFIYNTLPIQKLIKEISKYDFGINLSIMDKSKSDLSNLTFNGGMGTKLYTFLEAGLPVLVNKEYSYMSELLEKNNIGMGISSEDIIKTNKILRKVDIKNLKSNVKKFYETNNIWKKGEILKEFYVSLIN